MGRVMAGSLTTWQLGMVQSSISLTSARGLAPDAFQRWVMGGTALAAIGYATFVLLDIREIGWVAALNNRNAAMVVVAILSMAIAARGSPVVAAMITLVASWLEIEISFLIYPAFPSAAILVLPALVLGTGMLLGARVALVAAIVTLAATAVTHLRAPALQASGITNESIYFFAMLAVSLFVTWGLLALSLSGFRHVFDAMVANEKDLADTIRFAADGILVTDKSNQVLLANPAAESLLGLRGTELVSRKIHDVLTSTTGQAPQLTALAQEAGAASHEIELTARDGSTVWIEAAWRTMEGGRRQLLLRDVSQRVRAESERRTMELQLSHAQRLDAVGRLAGGLSHDFNNILTAVSGSAEMLRFEPKASERAELVDEIIAARDRGVALTRQLLAFARREVTQPRVIDLATHVRGLQRLLERVAGDRTQIRFVLASDCRVRVDPGQLEQALVNLVSNAADAMPHGGHCTNAVERRPAPGAPDKVLLQVTDTGTGMSEETAAHAFEPFFTTKPRGQGTGLGLASVHGMAAQSAGHASVTSTVGQGTRVTIELPWIDEPATQNTPVVTATQPTRVGPYTILIAEDDRGTRRVAERILRHAGYTVLTAADGITAMALLEDPAYAFDLVLSDVMMPGYTGPAIADRMASIRPGTPVLLMTGYAEEQLVTLLDQQARREIITKPFSADSLTARVAALLRAPPASRQPTG